MRNKLKIETERLILMPAGADPRDGDDMSRAVLESINELRPYAPWVKRPEDHTPELMHVKVQEHYGQYIAGTAYIMMARDKKSGEFCSAVELYNINTDRGICSAGYWAPTSKTGYGYTQEGLCALLEFGKNNLGLATIFATCHPENRASRHILSKRGFEMIDPSGAPEGYQVLSSSEDIQYVLRLK